MSRPLVVIQSHRVARRPSWLGIMDGALLRIGEEARLDGTRHTVPIIGLSGSEARVGLDAGNIAISPSGEFVAWSSGVLLCLLHRNDGTLQQLILPQDGEDSVYHEVDWAREVVARPLTGAGFAVQGVAWCDAAHIAVECAGPNGHRVQVYELNSDGALILYNTIQMKRGASGMVPLRGTATVTVGTATQRPLMADSLNGGLIFTSNNSRVHAIKWMELNSGRVVRECSFPKYCPWDDLTVTAFDGQRFAAASRNGDLIVWDGWNWSFHHFGDEFCTRNLWGIKIAIPNSYAIHALKWTAAGRLRIAVARVERNPDNTSNVSCVYEGGIWYAELFELQPQPQQ